MTKPYRLLFLCTGNSARSILAEYLARSMAGDRFEIFSAGSAPKPTPHPLALETLRTKFQIEAVGARSKSTTEFANTAFDFVITLCDNAKENCPVWPGQPILAHWGSPDPAAAEAGQEQGRLFWLVAQQIRHRLDLFFSLPIEKLDALALESATRRIGTQASEL